MRKPDFQNRLSAISTQSREQNQNSLDQARMLFEEISGEVRRQSEIEREAERHRNPFLKFLLGLLLISIFCAVSVGIYGIYNFPDAPLKQNGEIYTGKHGKPYTKEDFERFVRWKNALFVSFAASFMLGFTFTLLETRGRRKHKM